MKPGLAARPLVMVVNEQGRRLETLLAGLSSLGHDAHADHGADPVEAGERLQPAAVLVGRRGTAEEVLALIGRFVHEGSYPVIALLPTRDPDYVRQAARRGAFAYVVGTDARDLRAALDVALERFSQYRNLQDAFARRALVEQAKGILMARHGIDDDEAFDRLRAHARRHSRKVTDIAKAVIESHLLVDPALRRAGAKARSSEPSSKVEDIVPFG